MSHFKNKFNATKIISDFRKVLGKNYVQLHKAGKESSYLINLFPKNTEEIQECLKIANAQNFPLFVASTGRNWGYDFHRHSSQKYYGFLMLSRLNQILNYSEKFGFVTIEPGVTFKQLFEFLQAHKSSLMLAATGGSPESSVVAHILERGIAKGPVGIPFHNSCGYEVVLPSGKLLHTDHARFPKAKTSELSDDSFGPLFNGLFTQSNFGVVTKMTVWLEKKPREAVLVYFYIKKNAQLPAFINAIRELKIGGIVKGNLLLANRYRILASIVQYPWKEANGKTPLPNSVFSKLTKEWDWKGEWYGEIALYTHYPEIAKASLSVLRRTLKGVVEAIRVLDGSQASAARLLIQSTKKISQYDNNNEMSVSNLFFESNMLGTPTTIPMRSLYWRKKEHMPQDLDPVRDRCGVLWINTVVPFAEKDIKKVNQIASVLMLKYSFEPNIGFNLLSDRTVILVASILFDEDDSIQNKNAHDCFMEINNKLSKLGYLPYRINPYFRHIFPRSQGEYDLLVRQLKKNLDPKNIVSPTQNY